MIRFVRLVLPGLLALPVRLAAGQPFQPVVPDVVEQEIRPRGPEVPAEPEAGAPREPGGEQTKALSLERLPAPNTARQMEELAHGARDAVVPLRALIRPPSGFTLPVSLDRRGWAVRVRDPHGGTQLVVPQAFVAGASSLEVERPDGAGCTVKIVREDPDLGMIRIEISAPSELGPGCPLASGDSTMPLLPVASGLDSLRDSAGTPLATFLLPPPGSPVPAVAPLHLLGRGANAEAFYLLHDAAGVVASPILDEQGRLVGLTCGPSVTRSDLGLAIDARALGEFLSERVPEGRSPYAPSGQGPSWPPVPQLH